MKLAELLALFQHEIQKSYDSAAAAAAGGQASATLQLAVQEVEVEVPVAMRTRTFTYSPEKTRGKPLAAQLLDVPLHKESVKNRIPERRVQGQTLDVELLSPDSKVNESAANTGRLKFTFKPVLR